MTQVEEQGAVRRYWDRVRTVANALATDGCTAVPDFSVRPCCERHDIHYATGKDLDGRQISKWRADWKFYQCMRATGGTFAERALVSTGYWIGVTVLGWPFWLRSRRKEKNG